MKRQIVLPWGTFEIDLSDKPLLASIWSDEPCEPARPLSKDVLASWFGEDGSIMLKTLEEDSQ